jgi:hypothetical protein
MSGNRNRKFEQGDRVIYKGTPCEVYATGPNTVGIRYNGGILWVNNDMVVLAD